jgi:hypothetical protein
VKEGWGNPDFKFISYDVSVAAGGHIGWAQVRPLLLPWKSEKYLPGM